MNRIILVDDQCAVRQALRQTFAWGSDFEVVAEAGSGEEAVALANQVPADLMLLDYSMPGLSGVRLIERLHHIAPDLPVMVLSMEDDPVVVTQALASGAAGFAVKGRPVASLFHGMQEVMAGRAFVSH